MSETGNVISERMAKSRKEKGWTIREVAERMGYEHPSRYSNWEFGLRVPKHNELIKAADVFGVSPAWLAGFTDHKGYAVSGEGEYITAANPTVATKESGAIKLSNASDVTAYHADYLAKRKIPEHQILLLTADDDAMTPTIQQGDELLIDRSRAKVKTADLFALVVEGRAWVRWIRPELTGGYAITAENSELYPPQHLSADEFNALNIIGRVARIARDR